MHSRNDICLYSYLFCVFSVTTMGMAIDLDTTTTDLLGELVVVGVAVEEEVALEEVLVHRQVQGLLLVLVEHDADKN